MLAKNRSDAREAIATYERMIKKAEWQTGHKGMNPDTQPRQFNRYGITIDSIDAATGHLPTKQTRVLYLNAVA